MNFADAVKSVLSQYAVFSGRARRSEFWWFVLFTVLVGLVADVLDVILWPDAGTDTWGPLGAVTSLALLIPSLAVGARRLHDTGRSGWWQLLLMILIIVGWIILIVWWCQDSKEDNQYGPSPKSPGQQAMPPYPGQMPPPANMPPPPGYPGT